MGTRNLTAVYYKGKYRIAQYGQWDGYPSGQGATVLNFLKNIINKEDFLKKLTNLHWINKQECDEIEKKHAEDWRDFYPYLSRDMGAEILEYVQEKEIPTGLKNSIDFAKDSLFCEWAYVVDFDKNRLEVYKGFQSSPLPKTERFYSAEKDDSGYYPIKMVQSYSLNKLPDEDKFIRQLSTNEKEA